MEWNNLSQVLEDYAVTLRNRLQDSYIEDDKVASGELLNSCEYIIEKDDRQIEVSLQLADYYKYIEYGRRPGKFPPPDKIRDWIKIKPILPREGRNGKLPTEQQLTYLISRKIALEGIEPSYNLTRTVKEINEDFEERIMEAINKDIDENLTVIFSEYFTGSE